MASCGVRCWSERFRCCLARRLSRRRLCSPRRFPLWLPPALSSSLDAEDDDDDDDDEDMELDDSEEEEEEEELDEDEEEVVVDVDGGSSGVVVSSAVSEDEEADEADEEEPSSLRLARRWSRFRLPPTDGAADADDDRCVIVVVEAELGWGGC